MDKKVDLDFVFQTIRPGRIIKSVQLIIVLYALYILFCINMLYMYVWCLCILWSMLVGDANNTVQIAKGDDNIAMCKTHPMKA